jgi:hypothetical protein
MPSNATHSDPDQVVAISNIVPRLRGVPEEYAYALLWKLREQGLLEIEEDYS